MRKISRAELFPITVALLGPLIFFAIVIRTSINPFLLLIPAVLLLAFVMRKLSRFFVTEGELDG